MAKKRWQKKTYALELANLSKKQADRNWDSVYSSPFMHHRSNREILIQAMQQSNKADNDIMEETWKLEKENRIKEFLLEKRKMK